MKAGKIIKLVGGVYTVADQTKSIHETKPLGIFRHKNISPKVGDNVLFEGHTIKKMLPRKNDFVRPAVANVDRGFLINAAKRPAFSFLLMDRFLVLMEKENVDPVIVVSKTDLLTNAEYDDLRQKLDHYDTYYPVVFYSKETGEGLGEIRSLIKDKTSVLAGQTGAGKSSLLNCLDVGLNIPVAEISEALGRGKHTTRHVELLEIAGGWVADTPGFSKLSFSDIDAEELDVYYPDIFERHHECKFNPCSHVHEPGCAVKEAVKNGDIPEFRYKNYIRFYEELKAQKPKY